VSLHNHLINPSIEVVMPLLYGFHHSQDRPMVNFVVRFGTSALLRVDLNLTDNPESVIHVLNPRNCTAACISLLINRLHLIKMLQNGYISDNSFGLPEYMFGILTQFSVEVIRYPGSLCSVQLVWYWWCYHYVSHDRPLVEISHYDKYLHDLNGFHSWPILDC